MTEAEWLSCDDPQMMLKHLFAQRRYARKLRLFACACCRQVWDAMPDERSRSAVEVAERYADKKARRDEANRAASAAHDAITEGQDKQELGDKSQALNAQIEVADTAWRAVDVGSSLGKCVCIIVTRTGPAWIGEDLGFNQIPLLRDVFGVPRPFPQPQFDKALRDWNGGVVRRLAQAAYDDRPTPRGHLDGAALNVLADALEDAGSADDNLLSHLRSPGPHVRGCWALDLILDKELT